LLTSKVALPSYRWAEPQLDALRKAHTECVEYHERLQVIAEQAIAFDLDDGVVVNYAKFGDVLAKISKQWKRLGDK
jgi:uncharacterized Rmd1/YagE family protein